MPHLITPDSSETVCTATLIDGEGTNNAQTSDNDFFWNTGEPSIFLKYARTVATNTDNAGQRKAKAKQAPRIRERGRGKSSSGNAPRSGRPQILIDLDAVKIMLQAGKTQQQCAAHFHVAVDTIRSRLGTKKPRIRDNTGSKFCTPIATTQQSDRTNSIAGRV